MLLVLRLLLLLLVQFRLLHPGHPRPPALLLLLLPSHTRPRVLLLLLLLRPPFVLLLLLLLVELLRLLMLLLLLRSRLRLLLRRRPLIALGLAVQAPCRTAALLRSGRRSGVLAACSPGEFPTGRAPCSCGHDVDEKMETFKK